MSRYQQTLSRIAKLQKAAEKIRKKELAKVIKKIKKEMSAFDLTTDDIKLGKTDNSKPKTSRKKRRKTRSKRRKLRARKPRRTSRKLAKKSGLRSKVKPKYINSETKETWSGRGLRPRWLAKALADGKKLEDFAV